MDGYSTCSNNTQLSLDRNLVPNVRVMLVFPPVEHWQSLAVLGRIPGKGSVATQIHSFRANSQVRGSGIFGDAPGSVTRQEVWFGALTSSSVLCMAAASGRKAAANGACRRHWCWFLSDYARFSVFFFFFFCSNMKEERDLNQIGKNERKCSMRVEPLRISETKRIWRLEKQGKGAGSSL